ncbi:DNA-binding NtrC family response regulator [Alteromonadaceae bacterium 2753L.S.0a.02]|nr:DNA-binding NtrC family response regulator [Alteromonadaceae bacterium 2753L.S.0a.02]
MANILIIDDNPAVASALALLLELHDIESTTAITPNAGLQALSAQSFDLVIQDMNFTEDTTSGKEGERLFSEIRSHYPDIPVILITAWAHLESAVALVKSGASDYVEKPWDDNKLITTINNLLELSELQAQRDQHSIQRDKLHKNYDLCGLVFQSTAMSHLVETAIKIAPANVPVLITGANGSGKEKIAEIIQKNSRVQSGPFIRVNAGALPNDLLEAELFGAEAGAYTGITKQRSGRFEAAHGGTLFLDEIANLSAAGQAKLLRVLQSGEFERLGSSQTRFSEVRIISATNADLPREISEGKFREDLYYRLNVIELAVPPLADRPEDIAPLLVHFLGPSQPSLSNKLLRQLQHYPWPGNIRELQNACKRAQLLAKNKELSWGDFGLQMQASEHKPTLKFEPDETLIQNALDQAQGNISHAARQLGLTRQALYRRLQKYGIDV